MPKRVVGMDYPRLATYSATEGTVRLKCLLDEDGLVSSIEVVSGVGLLAEAAQANARQWKFARPQIAMRSPTVDSHGDGQTTGILVLVYEFRISGVTTGSPTSRFVFDFPDRVSVTTQSAHWMPQHTKRGRAPEPGQN